MPKPVESRPYVPPGRPIKQVKPHLEARNVRGSYNVEDRRPEPKAVPLDRIGLEEADE